MSKEILKEENGQEKQEMGEAGEKLERESAQTAIENIAISTISEIETAGKEFTAKFNIIKKSISSFNLESSLIKKVKEKTDFSGEITDLQLEEIETRREAIRKISLQTVGEEREIPLSRRDFLEILKKAGLGVFLTSLWPSESDAFLGRIFKSREKEEREKLEKSFYGKNIEAVRKELMNDKKERVFGFFTDSEQEMFGRKKWVEYKNAGGATSGWIPFGLIKKELIENEYRKAKIIHTHPLESFESNLILKPEEIEKIRQGKTESPPMPPSFMDISTMMRLSDFLGEQLADRVENEVIDPMGVWRYSVGDKESELIKKWNEYIKVCENYEQFLSKEETEFLRKFGEEHGESLKTIDPRMIPIFSRQYPELSKILDKLSKEIIEAAPRFLSKENILFLEEIEFLGRRIAENTARSRERRRKRESDIKAFIDGWKKKGVNVSYQSFLK